MLFATLTSVSKRYRVLFCNSALPKKVRARKQSWTKASREGVLGGKMKILILGLLLSFQTHAAIVSQLTVCPDPAVESKLHKETVTWLNNDGQQSISFEGESKDGAFSHHYAITNVATAESGASEVSYQTEQGSVKSISIYCDAVMDEDNGLLTTFNCNKAQ
jgi:hypothetical protein